MTKNIYGAMIASSLVLATLAGCNTPNPAKGTTSTPGSSTNATTGNTQTGSNATGNTQTGSNATGNTQTGSNASAAGTSDTGSEAAAAMAQERDMDDYGNMTAQEDPTPAAYSALALDMSATGAAKASAGGADASATGAANANAAADLTAAVAKVRAGQKLSDDEKKAAIRAAARVKISLEVKAKVQARIKERNQKIAARLDKLADQREKLRNQLKDVKWVDNGDGTSSKTYSIDNSRTVNGKTVSTKANIKRTIQNDTKAEISWHADFDQMLAGGLHRVSTRDKVLQADGSYLVTFHSELTLPNGAKRTSDWTKTIAADGSVSGTGTITWADKDGKVVKTVTITLSGDEDAPKCKDDAGKAAVTLPTTGDAQVTTDAGATTTAPADPAAVDATAAASASASASTGTGTADAGASASASTTTTVKAS